MKITCRWVGMAGPILESKDMRASFQTKGQNRAKKGKKMLKKGKRGEIFENLDKNVQSLKIF